MERLALLLGRFLDRWRARRGLRLNAHYNLPSGKILLHVGCGAARREHTGPGFQSDEWVEVRLDIDPIASPDIVGTILDMSLVADESVDAVFSSHTLEHLYAHEVPFALAEMKRVLKPDGVLVIAVPDLQSAAQMIAEDRLFDPAYISAAGTITPFDILYSYRGFVGRDRPYMAHHGGFTLTTLMSALREAGFGSIAGRRRPAAFDLWALATTRTLPDSQVRGFAETHFPD